MNASNTHHLAAEAEANLGVTAPKGFRVASTTAGIKPSGKSDLVLLVNDGPQATAAAVFTRNKVFAAPVAVTREHVANGQLRAVVVNAGNANACTGRQGIADAQRSAAFVGNQIECDAADVAVCSTGVIGEYLPVEKLEAGIESIVDDLAATDAASLAAAEAIMTTDVVPKRVHVQRDGWSIGGMGKGAGMMAPSLATMLVFLTTDAEVSAETAKQALVGGCEPTFNRLDIDGSTSTNDTVIVMGSGASGVSPSPEEFADAVREACDQLAAAMQADAEGVTKRVSITVSGAASDAEALEAARVIGRDNLVKTAMFGSDPNWGRVLAAVGMAPVQMAADNLSVTFNGHTVCAESAATADSREVDLSGPEIAVEVNLATGGSGEATVRTTDLSHAYVEINSAYTT